MNRRNISTKNLILCSLFAALIAVGAFIKIPLPYGDYFTLQTLFVLLAGLLLGAKKGAITVAVYVFIGIIGIPVFAGGGGIGYIFKPSFGYLIGFIVGAFVTGYISSLFKEKNFIKLLISCFIGLIMIYIIGLTYKYFMVNFYLGQPLGIGAIILLIFPIDFPCDVVLCFIGAYLGEKLYSVISYQ